MSFVCLSSGFGGRSTGSGWCHGRVDTAGLNSGSGAARRRGAPQDGSLAPCLPQPWLPFSHSHGSSRQFFPAPPPRPHPDPAL